VTIDKIVRKIRERYACGWGLSDTAAQKLILDFVRKRIKEELKHCKQYHECEEEVK
jgi:hypothetical protein